MGGSESKFQELQENIQKSQNAPISNTPILKTSISNTPTSYIYMTPRNTSSQIASPQITSYQNASSSSTSTTISTNSDYQTLLSEIKNTIDKNDLLFKQIEQANYPNAGSYTSDLMNYKIDTQVEDLTKTRQQIWDFLNKKYTENTNLRKYYFDEIRKADLHIKELEKQQQDLIDSIQSKTVKTSTADENIRNEKYNYSKMEYYIFLYKVMFWVGIFILLIITLCLLDFLSRSTCLVIVVILLIALTAFVGYYVFFVNIGRNVFSWQKFDHDNSSAVKNQQCSTDTSTISQSDKQKANADKAIDEIINKSKNQNESCSE